MARNDVFLIVKILVRYFELRCCPEENVGNFKFLMDINFIISSDGCVWRKFPRKELE